MKPILKEMSQQEKIAVLKRIDVDLILDLGLRHGLIKEIGGKKDNGEWVEPREIAEASIHKSRIKSAEHFTDAELELSRLWLQMNNWKVPFIRVN